MMMPSETQHGLARCVAGRIPRHRSSTRARCRCSRTPHPRRFMGIYWESINVCKRALTVRSGLGSWLGTSISRLRGDATLEAGSCRPRTRQLVEFRYVIEVRDRSGSGQAAARAPYFVARRRTRNQGLTGQRGPVSH